MSATPIQPDPKELAALYVAGAMTSAEAEAFEARLIAGDAAYVVAFESLRDLDAALSRAIPPAEPRMIERSNLINALGLSKPVPSFAKSDAARPADSFAEDAADMVLLRRDEVDWKDTDVPGVQARNLYIDRDAKRVTVLLRLAPGVVYPDHDHPGVEECLVIEGDLELGGKIMRAGDYIRIPKGGQHGTPRTAGGCLLLVTSPLMDAA